VQRKIIQQSATSLGISLPSKWTKKWNLKKGNLIDLEEKDNLLEIKPEKFKPAEKKITIDTAIYGELIGRVFPNLSKKGYDEIKVLYKKDSDLQPLKKAISNEVVMFETIKKESDYIILRAISEIDEKELENIKKRIIFLMIDSIQKIKLFLDNNNPDLLNDLIELELAGNKFTHICMRAINKQPEKEHSHMEYTFIWQMEKLGNDFKFFAKANPKNMNKKIISHFARVMDNLKLVMEIYLKYDPKKAVEFYSNRNKLNSEALVLLNNKNNPNENNVLHLSLSMTEKALYLLGLIFGSIEDQYF